MTSTTCRVADYIARFLADRGVRHVFVLPGGGAMHLNDGLACETRLTPIPCHHEQACGIAAEAWGRVDGSFGVAMVTTGPGATNIITPVTGAWIESVPMFVISGQVKRADLLKGRPLRQSGVQEADIIPMVQGITNYAVTVEDPSLIRYHLERAYHAMCTGRSGPVWLDIPLDVQAAPVDTATLTGYTPPPRQSSQADDPAMLDKLVEMLTQAERPLILAGHGVIQSGAMPQVLALAERAQIPVTCTLLGLGSFPASHELNLGMMGMHGEYFVNQSIQQADLLIACGMRFDDRVTGSLATYAPNAKKIHIDIDPAEINKNVHVDIGLIGDLARVLDLLLPQLPSRDGSAWLKAIRTLKGDGAVRDIQNLPDNGHLYAAHVMLDLWRATCGEALIATDVGQHQMWEAQYYKHEQPRSLVTSGGLGTMGFALPAAIGAKIACPNKEVWAIAGDGGFQMTSPELATIAQEKLDINIAVINNGYLGMVRQWQEAFYEKNYQSSPILSPDFVKLADAYGIPGAAVRTRREVQQAVAEARARKGPFLINFLVEQEDSVYPMVPAGAGLHEMIRRPHGNPLVETASDI